jgi:hypothetical protein
MNNKKIKIKKKKKRNATLAFKACGGNFGTWALNQTDLASNDVAGIG